MIRLAKDVGDWQTTLPHTFALDFQYRSPHIEVSLLLPCLEFVGRHVSALKILLGSIRMHQQKDAGATGHTINRERCFQCCHMP